MIRPVVVNRLIGGIYRIRIRRRVTEPTNTNKYGHLRL